MRILHKFDDLSQGGFFSNFGGFVFEHAQFIERRADDRVTGFLFNRQRLARQHGFIDGTAAFDHHTVHSDLLAWLGNHHITHTDIVHGYFGLHTITDDTCGLGTQTHQLLDGFRGASLGAGFEELAQLDERDDDRRRFVIDMSHQPTEGDRQGVEECSGGAHRNEHVHVRRLIADRFERANIILPAHIELHRQSQCQH